MPDDLHKPVTGKRLRVRKAGNAVWKLSFLWDGKPVEMSVAAFPFYAIYMNSRFVGSDEFAFVTTYDLKEWLEEGLNTLEILLVGSPEGGWIAVESDTSPELRTETGCWRRNRNSPLLGYELKPMQRGTLKHPWDGGGQSYKALPYRIEHPVGYVGMTDGSMFPSNSDVIPHIPGSYVRFPYSCTLDFGKETTGYTGLLLNSPEKCRLRISASESIDGIDADPWYHADVVVPISKGFSKIICPVRKGYRFLRLTSDRPVGIDLHNVANLRPYREFPRKGSFCCSDDLYNRIFDVSAYTVELCAQRFLEDGVKRDRLLWTGDLRPMAQVMYLHFGDTSMAREALYSFSRHTNQRGIIQPTFPWITGWVMADYVMWWIVSLDDHLVFTGDLETLRDLETTLVTQVDWLYRQTDDCGRFVVKLEDNAPITCWSSRQRTGTTGYHQGLWIKTLDCLQKLFNRLEKPEYSNRAADYLDKAISAAAAMQVDGLTRDYCLEGKPRAAISLDSNLHLNTNWDKDCYPWDTEFGSSLWYSPSQATEGDNYVMPLYNAYEFECVFPHNPQRASGIADRCFGHMMRRGSTTYWERYGLDGEPTDTPMTSLCHGWSGYMAAALFRVLLKRSHWLDSSPLDIRKPIFDLTGCMDFEWVEATIPFGEGMIELKAEGGAVGSVEIRNESGVNIAASVRGGKQVQIQAGSRQTLTGSN